MLGTVAALFRHPVKGFTPEPLFKVLLEAGAAFPCDRLFAVENGPSGFDAAAPAFLSKSRFTVLASIPALARARTAFDAATGVLTVSASGFPPFAASLADEAGRTAFSDWLEAFIAPEDRRGALRVLEGPGGYRFMDDKAGAVSLLNLASVRDLAARLGRPVDPLRFRANVHVEGWAPWAEMNLAPGAQISLGGAEVQVVKPIVRCAATHVDPKSGERDVEIAPALRANYGHLCCGLYLQVAWGGEVAVGAEVQADLGAPPPAPAPNRQERRTSLV
jgi:uncharacterized protein YcbX